jgi:hypothetical protein
MSTNYVVLTYQRDLANARISELNSIISYNVSLAALERSMGTNLKSRNINLSDYAPVSTDLSASVEYPVRGGAKAPSGGFFSTSPPARASLHSKRACVSSAKGDRTGPTSVWRGFHEQKADPA